MKELPVPIQDYIYSQTIETTKRRSPAYLLVSNDGRIVQFGGNLLAYGLDHLHKGAQIEQHVDYLTGLIPLDGEPLLLPCVKSEARGSMDIHIFPGDEGDWVLLLEASEFEAARGEIQQRSLELSLMGEKQARMLEQFVGQDLIESLEKGKLKVKKGGERRNLTILFADIRGFTAFSEVQHPQVVFRTLNAYLRSMMQPILDEASSLNSIIGDQVMAVLGLLSASASHQFRAVKAALSMMDGTNKLYDERKARLLPALKIGIGIASGPVAVGILGTRERKTITVIGHHVNLASRLQDLASPGEILIDKNTYDNIRTLKRFFGPTTHECKGMTTLVRTYSSQLRH